MSGRGLPASAYTRGNYAILLFRNPQGLFKKMAESGAGQPKKMTLEAGPMTFHYIIANNVAFLTLADKVRC